MPTLRPHSGICRPMHRCRQAGRPLSMPWSCALSSVVIPNNDQNLFNTQNSQNDFSLPSGHRIEAAMSPLPTAGSLAVKDIFTPAELPPGAKVAVIVLQFRASGPTLSPITPQLRQAFDQTFQVGTNGQGCLRRHTTAAPVPACKG